MVLLSLSPPFPRPNSAFRFTIKSLGISLPLFKRKYVGTNIFTIFEKAFSTCCCLNDVNSASFISIISPHKRIGSQFLGPSALSNL